MKAYVAAPKNLSRAMFRVANALERFAPDDIQIVQSEDAADLLVLHVIGPEAVGYRLIKPVAVLQYCTGAAERTRKNMRPWYPLWQRARVVWSYYDLQDHFVGHASTKRFYHAPLGIDSVFRGPFEERERDYLVMTSGYVNGHGMEAIEEPTLAVHRLSGKSIHLGPPPEGLTRTLEFNTAFKVGDSELAEFYRRCKWIAGLRYVEGFEMGVIEGLACGVRPIVFDRPDNRHWFGPHAEYVIECSGDPLTNQLASIMLQAPHPVDAAERAAVLKKFSWKSLVTEFWDRVKETA